MAEFEWTFNITLLQRRGAACTAPRKLNLLATGSYPLLKPHRNLVRAVRTTGFAHPIHISPPTIAVDVIGVGTALVRHSDNQHTATINVDVTRGRPTPEEVHRLQAVHFVTTRVQRDLHQRSRRWCRCRRECGSCCGCCCCSRRRCGTCSLAWTGRFHSGRGTSTGAAAGYEPASVEQASGRAAFVVCAVLRSGAPRIAARVVDPHLLVNRQTQAAHNPQFIVLGEPASCLAHAARGGQRRNGAPRVCSRVICELCARRGPAAYHVDFTIEQHPGHVALACGHRRTVGIAIGHRIVDKDLIVACAYRIVPTDHVNQAIERYGRPTGARRGQIHAITPSVSGGVIDLHQVQWATELDAVEPARHVDAVADGCCTGLRVRDWDRRSSSPHAAVKEVRFSYVWSNAIETAEHV